MAKLTARNNEKWNFNSLEGKLDSGIICHACGQIVKCAWGKWDKGQICYYCGDCIGEQKDLNYYAMIAT